MELQGKKNKHVLLSHVILLLAYYNVLLLSNADQYVYLVICLLWQPVRSTSARLTYFPISGLLSGNLSF